MDLCISKKTKQHNETGMLGVRTKLTTMRIGESCGNICLLPKLYLSFREMVTRILDVYVFVLCDFFFFFFYPMRVLPSQLKRKYFNMHTL